MKKKKEKQEVEAWRLPIQVRTVRNGYLLDLGNEAYMYYDEAALLEGFILHVGMQRKGAITAEQRSRLTEALKEGSAVRELQREVTELKTVVVEQKKVIRTLKSEIKKLED